MAAASSVRSNRAGNALRPACAASAQGDLAIAGDEECEDGNTDALDGCDEQCRIEAGYACTLGALCHLTTCGDSKVEGGEQCDDGPGDLPYDGCYNCLKEPTCGVDALSFERNADGDYVFFGSSFFPLDARGFVAEGFESLRSGAADETDNKQHNFHFTSELRSWFEYQGGEFLEFKGDDDVWVFVNGQLAVDIGGVHGIQTGDVTLEAGDATDSTDTRFNITRGGIYEVVVFQAALGVNLGLPGLCEPGRQFRRARCGFGRRAYKGCRFCDPFESSSVTISGVSPHPCPASRSWVVAVCLVAGMVNGCGRLGFELLPAAGSPQGTSPAVDANTDPTPFDAAIEPSAEAGPQQPEAGQNADAGNPPADAGSDVMSPPSDAGQAYPDAMSADSGYVFNGHSYALIGTTQDWAASQNDCLSLGMHLVQIDDMAEQTFVWNLNGDVSSWIGATDIEQEGAWHWSFGGPQFWSGSDVAGAAVDGRFVYWDPGREPDNAGPGEHCAFLYLGTGGRWADVPCDITLSAVCESY